LQNFTNSCVYSFNPTKMLAQEIKFYDFEQEASQLGDRRER